MIYDHITGIVNEYAKTCIIIPYSLRNTVTIRISTEQRTRQF